MPKQRGRARRPLSRERVVAAAVKRADRDGLESLSMRKLAEDLGVEAMSLYNHVKNKDDILDAIVDEVVAEIERPDPAIDWKLAMHRRAVSAYEVLSKHPWATMLIVSRVNVGPAMLAYIEATLACLRGAGFSQVMTDHAWNAVDCHIYGFTLQQQNYPVDPSEYKDAAESYIAMIPPETYPHMNAMTHEIISGRYDGLYDFEFGLNLVLDGLEKLLPPEG